MTSVNGIRQAFLDFFSSKDHEIKPSAPLIPQDDPTLLFVNAGMVPFKNIFTGTEAAFAPRAVTSQKCLRAGGKHNDLDNVGYTARHHTFFEMLGNFSFGDYFKENAIDFAWEMVTKELGLAKDRLLVTVYAEDDEAHALWKKVAGLPDDRIIRIGTSDNFWSMGETGPCGPCSEIFYDHGDHIWGGPPGSLEEDGDRFIEIWNLVFMQYEQVTKDKRVNLPKPSIDTGMGLERISTILQGVHNNYDIDLFKGLIAAEEDVYKQKTTEETLASFRVIADHLRATSFLIADGVTPSNEGRGYVLRRIMRRAMRHGHLLGAREPLMHKLVPALISEMGEAYPELGRAKAAIENNLSQEEERFQRTLGRGLALLSEATETLSEGDVLSGETAFRLYDTYGFPADLTADILRGQGMTYNQSEFDDAMAKQKEGSRVGGFSSGDTAVGKVWFDLREELGTTKFSGYDQITGNSELVAIVKDGERVKSLNAGETAELLFRETPFYAESGGQAGDKGKITFGNGQVFTVCDTQKRAGELNSHMGALDAGSVMLGEGAALAIDNGRRMRIRSNHSATHLLHAALRDVLGEHVTQKGSLVEEDRFRFDFSHGNPLTRAEIAAVEKQVNAVIRQNEAVSVASMAPDKAIEAGALALFGEKYGDVVRVLAMGNDLDVAEKPYSVELCGGTHVARTGDIAVFTIVAESGVSAGVRRVEAMTGQAALDYMGGQISLGRAAAEALKTPLSGLPERIQTLQDQRKRLEAELSDVKRQLAMGGGGGGSQQASGPEEINGVKLIARVADGVPAKDLRSLIDDAKGQMGSGIAAFISVNDGKAAIAIGVTDDLKDTHSAVDLVRVASAAVGGKGGGGRPDMAQAGGPDGSKANEALDAIRQAISG